MTTFDPTQVSQTGIIGLIAMLLALGGMVWAAVRGSKAKKQEKRDAIETERKADAAAGDLDLEHLDRERMRRL